MFDKIVFISDQGATVKLKDSENITMNLMNLHLVFEDATKMVLGEVNDVNGDTITTSFLGEITGNRFIGGTIRKPRLDAKIRVINDSEIQLITGKDEHGFMKLGNTPFYEGTSVFLDVNNFFSSHFAIFGNSGSGKSCGITRLFQNMFHDQRLNPYNANIIMFDSSGEYYNAFSNLNSINPNYHYRFISTNDTVPGAERLRIPIYLLNVDDLALLLQVTNHSQLPIVERMRKLALVFSQKDMDANNYKNHLIAKAIMTILYTSETAPNKRNEVFSILASCSTPQFNLEATVQGIGYTRKFRECFLIDNSGNFSESVLLTEYVSSFIDDELDSYEPDDDVFYTLDTLEKALNFTLISEGWLRNKNTYGDAVTLKVRLHSLIVSSSAEFFDVREYMSVEDFLRTLVNKDGRKCQFVNINLDDVDDTFAKVITKIFSRLIFDYSKALTQRASMPFHIVVEEAHRYIQNDTDRFLIGYNIFERIAKEGRKYGVILGIITQRPVELSDTVISQCTNFLIFKINHPVDVDYIRKMVPNISDEIIEKQKNLQSGTCLGFGSAFRIPMIVRMEMPDPAPWSGNCDVVSFWGGGSATASVVPPTSSGSVSAIPELNEVSVPAVPSIPNVPTAIPTDVAEADNSGGNELVKLNDGSSVQTHSGEFGLLDEDEIPAGNGGGVAVAALPTTDTGVSLVSLSSDVGNSSAPAETVEMPPVPTVPTPPVEPEPQVVSKPVDIAPVASGIPSMTSDTQSQTEEASTPMPLVSFTGGGSLEAPNHVNTNSDNTNNVGNPPVESAPSLVSFNEAPQMSSMIPTINTENMSNDNNNNFTPQNMANNINPMMGIPQMNMMPGPQNGDSNVTAAPMVDTTSFISTGNADEETLDVPSPISFVNTPAPMSANNMMAGNPGMPLVNMNGGGGVETPQKTPDELQKQSQMNDTFGKPDFSDMGVPMNMGMNMNMASNMVPANSAAASASNGFLINAPSNMNFGGDSGAANVPTEFTPGNSLASFIEQMN